MSVSYIRECLGKFAKSTLATAIEKNPVFTNDNVKMLSEQETREELQKVERSMKLMIEDKKRLTNTLEGSSYKSELTKALLSFKIQKTEDDLINMNQQR